MLTIKEQKKLLKKWIPKLKKRMHLEDWDIRTRWKVDEQYSATVDTDLDYRLAYIEFSPEERTHKQLFKILLHEMCHIQHGFDELDSTYLQGIVNPEQAAVIRQLKSTFHEDLVRRLENTYLGCGWYADFK